MASPTDQLVVTRWVQSQNVLPAGPDINNLEAVIQLITSIPFASTITNGLGLDAACRFTVIRPFKSTTGDIGVRFRVEGGTAGSVECAVLLGRTDGKLHFYKNNGSEAAPVWSGGFYIDVVDGSFRITYGTDPFDPIAATDFDLVHKKYVDDAVAAGGGGGSSAMVGCAIKCSGSATVAQYAIGAVNWNTLIYQSDTYWVIGTPTRLTVPTGLGGDYEINFSLEATSAADAAIPMLRAFLYINGVGPYSGSRAEAHCLANAWGQAGAVYAKALSAGDYVELKFTQLWRTSNDGVAANMILRKLDV